MKDDSKNKLVKSLILNLSEIFEDKKLDTINLKDGKIEFSNVSFNYGEETKVVLKSIN